MVTQDRAWDNFDISKYSLHQFTSMPQAAPAIGADIRLTYQTTVTDKTESEMDFVAVRVDNTSCFMGRIDATMSGDRVTVEKLVHTNDRFYLFKRGSLIQGVAVTTTILGKDKISFTGRGTMSQNGSLFFSNILCKANCLQAR